VTSEAVPGARGLRLAGPGLLALAVVALAVTALTLGATLAVAGDTLGYDFLAYHAAAARVVDGHPLYDTSFEAAGGFGLFYYPPPFLPLILPLGLLGEGAATTAWLVVLVAAFAGGVALMPVAARTRWLVVLLAGLSWPFLYAVKLGQVGPLLFLLFAAGWRWLERPGVPAAGSRRGGDTPRTSLAIGGSAAVGAAIKLQPGLVLAWALLTRRWAALAIGAVVLGVLAALATLLAGPGAWSDFLLLVGRVSDPITTPHNFTPGAVAYQLGVARDAASVLQLASMALALSLVVVAALRWPAVPSYLVVAVASQLLSPILWDHYAMLLLLPVAWLVERRQWWAVAIPLATSVVLVGAIPAWAYPAAFWVALIALLAVGRRAQPAPSRRQSAS
jgi:hypothetical protein